MSVVPNSWGRYFTNTASVVLVSLSMAACAMEKPRPPEGPSPIDKVTFTIDAKGNLEVVGAEGLSVKDCSLDSDAKDRCSFFDKKIEIEELQNIFFMRYKGSNCIIYGSGYRAKVICYP